MRSLELAPFNKVRLCVFPKHFKYNENEPLLYPFPVLQVGGDPSGRGLGEDLGWQFEFDRFEPAFFRHLEQQIVRLGELGIEVDLILFHPYDRWGFARMTADDDVRYLRYLIARLAAYRNVWWSMANEFDVLPSKSDDDWGRLLETVKEADPYDHLRSIHNCFRFFDHGHPLVTHVSAQRDNTAQTAVWASKYKKPVIIDECGYEGDLSDIWGNLSGQEMTHRIWDAVMNGAYATHGETFRDPDDNVFWAKGGALRGESVPRLRFLADILAGDLAAGVEPLASVKRLLLIAGGAENLVMGDVEGAGRDDNAPPPTRVVIPWFFTMGRPHSYYLTYFGSNQPSEMILAVPHGESYDATLLDTWGMTRNLIAEGAVRGQVLEFSPKPYQAIILRRCGIAN